MCPVAPSLLGTPARVSPGVSPPARFAKERKLRIWRDYVAPTANLDQKDKQFVAKVSGFASPPWTTWVPPGLGLPSVGRSQGLMASVQPVVRAEPRPCTVLGVGRGGTGQRGAGCGLGTGCWAPLGTTGTPWPQGTGLSRASPSHHGGSEPLPFIPGVGTPS